MSDLDMTWHRGCPNLLQGFMGGGSICQLGLQEVLLPLGLPYSSCQLLLCCILGLSHRSVQRRGCFLCALMHVRAKLPKMD